MAEDVTNAEIPIPSYICKNCGQPARDMMAVPRTATGRVIPSWSNQAANDLAFHIGSVVMAGAELDVAIAALAAFSHGHDDMKRLLAIFAQSGKSLRSVLRGAEQGDPELDAFLKRYEALYEFRNHIVHSYRPFMEDEEGTAIRMNLKAQSFEDLHIVRKVRMEEMIDYWYDVQELRNEVRHTLMRRAAGG